MPLARCVQFMSITQEQSFAYHRAQAREGGFMNNHKQQPLRLLSGLEQWDAMRRLESELGYVFRDKSLLTQALTHSSYANAYNRSKQIKDNRTDMYDGFMLDNERLEWLGDSLIGSAVSLRLYAASPQASEAALTKARSSIVSRTTLAEVGRTLKLGQYIYILVQREAANLNVLANTVEALIGAMYLDWIASRVASGNPRLATSVDNTDATRSATRSANPVDNFVSKFINLNPAEGAEGGKSSDWKSLLQEYLQGAKLGIPKYTTLSEQGPDHAKMFRVCVRWNTSVEDNSFSFEGLGNSLKRAQQAAAREAYLHLIKGSA